MSSNSCFFLWLVPGVMLTHIDKTACPLVIFLTVLTHMTNPLVVTNKLFNTVLHCSKWSLSQPIFIRSAYSPLPPDPWGQPGESDLPPTSGHDGQLPPWQQLLRAPHRYRYVKAKTHLDLAVCIDFIQFFISSKLLEAVLVKMQPFVTYCFYKTNSVHHHVKKRRSKVYNTY